MLAEHPLWWDWGRRSRNCSCPWQPISLMGCFNLWPEIPSAVEFAKANTASCSGQVPRPVSDSVAQWPDRQVLSGIPLNRLHPVQCGPGQDDD